jgi:predicted nuclease of predicted toxin-antitoxin system
MKILFDQGVPVPLRRALTEHSIETAHERGWSTLKNGALLAAAEQAGFDALVTTDQQLRYQQNLTGRRIAILVLGTTAWPIIRQHVAMVQAALDQLIAGDYVHLPMHPAP